MEKEADSKTTNQLEISERLIQSDPVLGNAWRLALDAHLLIQNERHGSAVALAMLCVEEIGKYLLSRWSAEDSDFRYDKNKFHMMKQAAIAALFMTDAIRKEYREQKINFQNLDSVEEMEKLHKAIKDGIDKEAAFSSFVMAKVFETIKWSGMYYDSDLSSKGIDPFKITRDNAFEIMTLTSRSFLLLGDGGNIFIARHAFPTVVGMRGK